MNPSRTTFSPSVTLDEFGNPVVAWSEVGGSRGAANVYVKRWNGTAWVLVGANPLDVIPDREADVPNVSLIAGARGDLTIAWDEVDRDPGINGRNVYVKRWNGREWILLGGVPLDMRIEQSAQGPNIAQDSSGNIVVAWREGNGFDVYVKRWNGVSWVPLTNRALNSNDSERLYRVAISIDPGGNAVVAWSEPRENASFITNTYAMRFND